MLAVGSPGVGLRLAARWDTAEEVEGSLRCSETSLPVGEPLVLGLLLDAFSLRPPFSCSKSNWVLLAGARSSMDKIFILKSFRLSSEASESDSSPGPGSLLPREDESLPRAFLEGPGFDTVLAMESDDAVLDAVSPGT